MHLSEKGVIEMAAYNKSTEGESSVCSVLSEITLKQTAPMSELDGTEGSEASAIELCVLCTPGNNGKSALAHFYMFNPYLILVCSRAPTPACCHGGVTWWSLTFRNHKSQICQAEPSVMSKLRPFDVN